MDSDIVCLSFCIFQFDRPTTGDCKKSCLLVLDMYNFCKIDWDSFYFSESWDG